VTGSQLIVLVVIACAVLLLAGCGGDSSSYGSATSGASSTQTAVAERVVISNFRFSPATDTVKPGAPVTVTNQDSVTHTVTADDGHSFDTGNLAHGGSQKISVSKPGTYSYHCTIHPYMHGTLVVK
jgi:plastocyanin